MNLRFLCEPYGLSAKMQGFATNKESKLRRGILGPQRIVGTSKSPRSSFPMDSLKEFSV